MKKMLAMQPQTKEEKKVEYLELIYDLIFVYIVGRNNSLIQAVGNGFVPAWTFIAYILCTLAVIQIWNYSTFYINMFGRNSVRDHIFLFVNMYLLYYIGEGTHLHWENFHTQYHVANGDIMQKIRACAERSGTWQLSCSVRLCWCCSPYPLRTEDSRCFHFLPLRTGSA